MERVLFLLALPAMGFALMTLCYGVVDGALVDWSGAKLAPMVAMWRGQPHGYQLYQDGQSGVMSGWIYGPIPAILMAPAALWSTPTPALITGATINALAILSPLVCLMWIVARRADATSTRPLWPFVAAGTCLLALLITSQESMRIVTFQINADGAALGFATAACAALIHSRTRTFNLALMSLFCGLAVWSKQTLAPFATVPLIFLWLTEGRRAMLRAAAILLGIGIALSAVLVCTFGFHNMWFNMVTLPGTDPWASEVAAQIQTRTFVQVVMGLLRACYQPFCILLLIFAIVRFSDPRRWSPRHIRQLAANEPWSILLLAALVMSPAAITGYSIVGGYVNHLALTACFLDAAAIAALISITVKYHDMPRVGPLARCSCMTLLVFVAFQIMLKPDVLNKMSDRIAAPHDNIQQRIYSFEQAHPGIVYFPWYPLPTLLAEGRLYHFQWGVIDRWLAGMPIKESQFFAHVPPGMQYVGYTSNQDSPFMLQLFPNRQDQTDAAELPGVSLYPVVPGAMAFQAGRAESNLAKEANSP